MFSGQYCDGRKCTSVSLNQLQTPSVGVERVTRRARSTAARSTTGSSNQTRIGMPTPTVCPSSGPMDGVTSVSGLTVVKLVAASTGASSAPSARAVSV
jgi:hypothetical protein